MLELKSDIIKRHALMVQAQVLKGRVWAQDPQPGCSRMDRLALPTATRALPVVTLPACILLHSALPSRTGLKHVFLLTNILLIWDQIQFPSLSLDAATCRDHCKTSPISTSSVKGSTSSDSSQKADYLLGRCGSELFPVS